MEIFVKKFPDCLRQAFVKVGIIEMGAEYDAALTMVQRDFSFSGFRKGNVPFDIIEKNNPNELTKTLVTNIVNKSISEMIQQGHKFYSEPKFTPLSVPNRHSPFVFTLVFESEPEVLGGFQIDKATIENEEFVVDAKMIDYSMKKQIGLLESVDGKVQSGDTVTVEIKNPDYPDSNKEKTYEADEVKALVGHKKGEKVDLTFDDLSIHVSEFLGNVKEPVSAEIQKIERVSSETLSDELVSQATNYKTLADFKKAIEESLNQLSSQLTMESKKNSLAEHIGKNVSVEFPKTIFMDKSRYDFLHFVDQKINLADYPLKDLIADKKVRDELPPILDSAYRDIAFIIVIDDYADKNGIEAQENYINYIAGQRARENKLTLDEYKQKSTQEEWESVKREAKREAALADILSKAKFHTKGTKPLLDIK